MLSQKQTRIHNWKYFSIWHWGLCLFSDVEIQFFKENPKTTFFVPRSRIHLGFSTTKEGKHRNRKQLTSCILRGEYIFRDKFSNHHLKEHEKLFATTELPSFSRKSYGLNTPCQNENFSVIDTWWPRSKETKIWLSDPRDKTFDTSCLYNAVCPLDF